MHAVYKLVEAFGDTLKRADGVFMLGFQHRHPPFMREYPSQQGAGDSH